MKYSVEFFFVQLDLDDKFQDDLAHPDRGQLSFSERFFFDNKNEVHSYLTSKDNILKESFFTIPGSSKYSKNRNIYQTVPKIYCDSINYHLAIVSHISKKVES